MSTGDRGEGSEDREVRDDPLAGHGDGDVVSFGSRELRGEGQSRPLTVRWEIGVAAGKRGDLLALEQTAAIRDMLAWLAARKQAKTRRSRRMASLRPHRLTSASHSSSRAGLVGRASAPVELTQRAPRALSGLRATTLDGMVHGDLLTA
jgi:hypothetical protein